MEEKDRDVEIIKEKYIQVSESRIKNTIKEYRSGRQFTGIVSSSLAFTVSFLIAFASYTDNSNVWKWIFLSLCCISTLVFCVSGIISLARKKAGKGTEKWFLEEIRNNHVEQSHPSKKSKIAPKKLFKIINVILLIGLPTVILLIVLSINGWNISNKPWSPAFWAVWLVLSLAYLIFGTFINSMIAYVLFGYEGYFDSDY